MLKLKDNNKQTPKKKKKKKKNRIKIFNSGFQNSETNTMAEI